MSDVSVPTVPVSPLLLTKLYLPPVRPDLVARPRLLVRLKAGLAGALTLISAPAGFGKTSLLAQALAGCQVAWLSVDDQDNDPVRFWAYVIAALQTVMPGMAQPLLESLLAGHSPGMLPLLATLLNEVSQQTALLPVGTGPILFVLDDYHAITAPEIYQGLSYLLEHIPRGLHLVLCTRVDPPLPLARLRAHREMAELRADDLRFTLEEALALLNEIMGLDLQGDDVQALAERTEGWVAGRQLAGLRLASPGVQNRVDRHGFIRAFAGSHHYVLEYLTDEVLSGQPQDVQQFLMCTSVLGRMCADLCDAVLDFPGSTQRRSQAVLEGLYRANLFLFPLDDDHRWYRYHHLFADLLRMRLQETAPELLPVLHGHAARWHEDHGTVGEAVSYALAAGDFDIAARSVMVHWIETMHRGEIGLATRWLDALPAPLVSAEPFLSIASGWGLLLSGHYTALEARLQDAERALDARENGDAGADPADPELPRQRGEIACQRSSEAFYRGHLEAAATFARQVEAVTPEQYYPLRGNGRLMVGHVYRELGDYEAALATYRQALPLEQAGGNLVAISFITFYMTVLQAMAGQLGEALRTCREVLRAAEADNRAGMPGLGLVYLAVADLLRQRNELAEAERYLAEGLALGRRNNTLEALKNGGLVAARAADRPRRRGRGAGGPRRSGHGGGRPCGRCAPYRGVRCTSQSLARAREPGGSHPLGGERASGERAAATAGRGRPGWIYALA